MFTSKEHLQHNLGVDPGIAAFFVDRKVPAGNLYWKGKYLYVAGGAGFLFIPLFFDLKLRCGVDRELLLNEEYVQLTEEILGSAALYEHERISFGEHIENCKKLVSPNIKNAALYIDLLEYFALRNAETHKGFGTGINALNRGDTFLFALCSLNISAALTRKVVQEWYALVPAFLLMDDIVDLKADQEKNEENSVEEFGKGKDGVQKAIQFLRTKFGQLKVINPRLGSYFEASLERKLQTPYMLSILNT